MVLLLPAEFHNNSMVNQIFTLDERKKIHKIFEERVAFHTYMDETFMEDCEDRLFFHADFVNMGEVFFAESNDLNSVPGDVREFEFFAQR